MKAKIQSKGPETPQRRAGNPNWKPGVSGNPGSRPKAVRELLELTRSEVPASFELAVKLLSKSTPAVLVADDGHVQGLVTRSDMLRFLMGR